MIQRRSCSGERQNADYLFGNLRMLRKHGSYFRKSSPELGEAAKRDRVAERSCVEKNARTAFLEGKKGSTKGSTKLQYIRQEFKNLKSANAVSLKRRRTMVEVQS